MPATDRRVIFFHCPRTRSSGTLTLLEELGAEYDLRAMNMKVGEHRQPAFLAINPLGKVPAIQHGGALVTEQAAIVIYLADLYPEAGLAPALTDPLRGPYLRWLVFYGSAFEPAVVDKAMQREPGQTGMSPYGSYDAVIDAVSTQLQRGPYLLGDRFTAADVLWGGALGWTMMFKVVPERPEFVAYVERVNTRPASRRAMEIDAKLAAEHEAAAS